MSFSIQYRPLFSLDMLHDFYLSEDLELFDGDTKLRDAIVPHQQKNYQLSRDLDISPTPDCSQILTDHQLVFKPTNRGFFVAAKVQQIPVVSPAAFSPFNPLDEPLCLRFKVNIKNPFFFNFTNFRIDKNADSGQRYLYYFSNRVKNADNKLYLSQPIPKQNLNQGYLAGDLYLSGVGLFEALQDIPPNNNISNYWKQIYKGQTPHFQFITHLDRLTLQPAVFEHTVFNGTQKHQELNILIFNVDDQFVDQQHFTAYDPANTSATLRSCSVDLRKMKPGVYRLEVRKKDNTILTDFGLTFYLDTSLYQQGPLAIIECFHNPNDNSSAYRWLDAANQNRLRQPKYELRWKNRSTFWRYYFAKPKAVAAPGSDVMIWKGGTTLADPRILITVGTRPLSQVFSRIEHFESNTQQPNLLPNPELNTIVYENGKVYSEVNAGGGLGPPLT